LTGLLFCRRRDRGKENEKIEKEYVQKLEEENEKLEDENQKLKDGQNTADRIIKELKVCQNTNFSS
jgi:cell division protein FtsB